MLKEKTKTMVLRPVSFPSSILTKDNLEIREKRILEIIQRNKA